MKEQRKPLSFDHRIAIGATMIGIPSSEYRRHVDAGEKWCSGCHSWHSSTVFVARRSTTDGLDNVCKPFALKRIHARLRRVRSEAG